MTLTSSGRATGAAAYVDPQHWPDVAVVPHTPLRAAIARRLFHGAVRKLPMRVIEPAAWYGAGTSADPVMRLVRPEAFFARLGDSGTIGFGEAYMAGDWVTDDLPGVLTAFAARMQDLVPPALQRLRNAVLHRQPAHDDNTIAGARKNIQRHYDLSNDLFRLFLDETMTYSAALFDGDPSDATGSLADAQRRKIDRLLDIAGVRAGSRVLEIGTGWGALAIRAAQRGAQVTTLTIST